MEIADKIIDGIHDRLGQLEIRMERVDGRLDNIEKTMATKSDISDLKAYLRQTMGAQTWRFMGTLIAVGGLVLAGIKLIP